MRDIFSNIFSSLKRFSFRGFLFRRDIKGRANYIIDLILVGLALIIFCMTVTAVVIGVVFILIRLLFGLW
jgi:hypothetical protein